jgi:D-serine deaminase-like pyridoxal phosphate-dependent protein
MKVTDLLSPAVIVDVERLDRNIESMASKAEINGVNLRPHIKTHKCIEIGRRQRKAGAKGITVSTPAEAQAFSDAGFTDITYAVPLAPDKFAVMLDISKKSRLNVLVDNITTIDLLEEFSLENAVEFGILLKVNCGNDRVGINPKSKSALKLAARISQKLNFKGILAHAGHSYSTQSVDEIKRIAEHEQDIMIYFAKTLKAAGIEPETVSIGSTPTARVADSFKEGITEIRPGNYVFFDYTQIALGTCDLSDVALTVLASVISTSPGRVVIDAGATALSKDRGPVHIDDSGGYGIVIKDYHAGIIEEKFTLGSLSQEHGKISTDSQHSLKPGDTLRIIPNHSCLTANLYDHYHVVQGDSVIDNWRIKRLRLGT